MILFDKVPLNKYITNLWEWEIEYEEDNPNYRCARGFTHVLNVAKVFVIIELIVIPIYVLFLFPWWIFWIGLHLLLIIVTLYALKKEKHRWMWPINLVAAVQFVIWALISVVKFILAIFSTDTFLQFYGQGHHDDFLTRAIIIILVKAVILFIGGILFWRLAVFHTTRKYFEEKGDGNVNLSDPEQATGIEKLMKPV
uniref:Uncharacterized protein n=1 Tax=Heterorhabditis bacteriophora TaxID=37862 RepID=A0A1I7WMX9_HETBA